ncbi:MAG: class I mannose-6-phosphate isomerase [Planctomycetes bacterium]|nr:class I mannose-6-phosphate isomerase [Planctomycetota bacterium]
MNARHDAAPRLLAARPVERPWGGRGLPEFSLPAPAGATIGEWWLPTDEFPLLVKVIDARENLSIQLHPDDELARRKGLPCGKSEAWLVLQAAPGARIFLGLREGVDAEPFLSAAAAGADVSPLLRVFMPRPGDLFFVPPGTVHAIGAGLVILEVQQVSDTTYRVFDWNREPRRPLHLADARLALRADPRAGLVPPAAPQETAGLRLRASVACEHFRLEALEVAAQGAVQPRAPRAEVWFCWQGAAAISYAAGAVRLDPGCFCLVPAGAGDIEVLPRAGARSALLARMRQP